MKKTSNYFSNVQFIFKMILVLFAVVTGGGLMAVADNVEPQIGDEGHDPSSKEDAATEPVDPDKSDRLAPGGKADGQDLTGTQGSATQVRKGGLAEEDWTGWQKLTEKSQNCNLPERPAARILDLHKKHCFHLCKS